jgi:phenylpropionate dioxygenase-like ring-hydroxylating dioxygenase large terminal subunit
MALATTPDLYVHDTDVRPPDLRRTGLNPDFWYPVARSVSLKPGMTLAVRFAGDPIVLARAKDGACFALENRCAHRQVPLSNGVVCPKGLRCGYHGWTYDTDGRCIDIPYLGKDQDTGARRPNGVRCYPCREAYGLIFIFPGDIAKAETTVFPEIPTHGNPKFKTRYLDRRVDCHYSFMHENLMDMNHQFLHRKLMGGIKTIYLGKRSGENWVEADYSFGRTSGKQSFGEWFIIGKKDGDNSRKRRDHMTIRTEYPYQTLKFWTAGSETPALDLWNVYIPVDKEQRVNHTFGMIMIEKPPIPGLIHLLWPFIVWFTEGIFREDRWIVELEQKAHDEQGADWNNEIFPVILGLRDLLGRGGVPLD